MSTVEFNIKEEEAALKAGAEHVLKLAKQQGATAAEVDISSNAGFSLTARLQNIETVQYGRDRGMSVTVYHGQKKGNASTTDLNPDSLTETVNAALAIAKATGEDPAAGLADKDLMAWEYPDLSLYHPWNISVDDAINLALKCEQIGMDFDPRINNSEGASFSTSQSMHVYANSHGFMGATPSTDHSMSCVLLAENKDGDMQRDYYYSSQHDASDLLNIEFIAKEAARRTLQRLGARKPQTMQVPVLFTPELARSFWGSLIGGIRGTALYRRSSFLCDMLGKNIFPSKIQVYQRPHIKKGLGSVPFDGEGVKTVDRHFVRDGVLESYVLGSYSARKLGMQTTGNAGGVFNLFIDSDNLDFNAMLKKMDKGVVIIELLGQGVNMVTGDYSRGAMGLWVENGEIQYPLHEMTIAGNLKEMFQQVVAVGNDVDRRGNIQTGSVLIEKMMIAG